MGNGTETKAQLDDNLDDFDDVLDEFTTKPLPGASSTSSLLQPPTSGTRARTNTRVESPQYIPGRPNLSSTKEVSDEELSSDFARELAKGMEGLMKELGTQPGVATNEKDAETDEGKERMLKAAWEAMLVEGMSGTDLASLGTEYKPEASGKSKAGGPPTETKDFQSKIQETMRKLRDSDGAQNDPDMQSIEALLKDLGMGEEGNDDAIAGVLEQMMGQLMSKDILYEPLKELNDKYPDYMKNPTQPMTAEDKQRYESQMICVDKIVKVFEDPKFSDSNALDIKKVVDLMSEMQSYGSPPESIMGPMPPGFGFGTDGMPQLPGECTII